ncbi:hypothetical protein V8C43DRAFT_164233 [Trichoderma afarasin]
MTRQYRIGNIQVQQARCRTCARPLQLLMRSAQVPTLDAAPLAHVGHTYICTNAPCVPTISSTGQPNFTRDAASNGYGFNLRRLFCSPPPELSCTGQDSTPYFVSPVSSSLAIAYHLSETCPPTANNFTVSSTLPPRTGTYPQTQ